MSADYPDYQALSYIQTQVAGFYYAEVFRKLDSSITVTDKRLVAVNQTWYVWNDLNIHEDGRFIVLGAVVIFGDS